MRFLLVFLGALGAVTLFAFGVPSVLVGIAEQRHIDEAYVVGFVPDASCDDAYELYLRVEDGAILDCVQAGVGIVRSSGRVSLPGFTDAQNQLLQQLAAELGSDGLSAVEQRNIQQRVDEFAATVPPEHRPYGELAVSGADRAWLGGGMIVAAIVAVIVSFRFGPPK